jgi:hypothetical protein
MVLEQRDLQNVRGALLLTLRACVEHVAKAIRSGYDGETDRVAFFGAS